MMKPSSFSVRILPPRQFSRSTMTTERFNPSSRAAFSRYHAVASPVIPPPMMTAERRSSSVNGWSGTKGDVPFPYAIDHLKDVIQRSLGQETMSEVEDMPRSTSRPF